MSARSMAALEIANEVRADRAKIRAEVRLDDSRERAYEVITFPPRSCQNLQVVELLRWVPLIRTFRAMKVCARANVGEGRRLGALTDRERHDLIRELRAA